MTSDVASILRVTGNGLDDPDHATSTGGASAEQLSIGTM